MCGIAGYLGPQRRFNQRAMEAMLVAIEHRGPDDSGIYTVDASGPGTCQVWLGNRRLAIQDLSPAGHQPMVDTRSGTVIAFNGEIYNFLELRDGLSRRGYEFESRCDTEVALRSWAADGLAAVQHWRGMFAAAIWDQRRSELWLVRDQWGIKPLYYWWDGETLAFCSEVRGLLASGLVPRQLSQRGLHDYLRYGSVQDPVTLVHGVYNLLPGYALRLSGGQLSVEPYPKQAAPAVPDENDVDRVLRDSVRQQLISDVPLGVFLSGGIDSSIVSLLARQEGGSNINSLSLIFDEPRFSEADSARLVANWIGTKHHEVALRPREARDKVMEAISRMDQPSVDGVNTYAISEAARQMGFHVTLSGLGGDEFFGGYPTFHRTSRIAKLQRCARLAPWLARTAGVAAARMMSYREPAALKLARFFEYSDFADHPYLPQRTLFYPRQIMALGIHGEAWSEADVAADARLEALLSAVEEDPLNQVSFLEARLYMANTLLRDSDQMSMANSIELRVPFVDQVLGARLFAVPGAKKGFGRVPKQWLRSCYERYLPPGIFRNKKRGFTLPFEYWLRSELSAEVENTLRSSSALAWNSAAVGDIWHGFRQGRVHWTLPWLLFVLQRWVENTLRPAESPLSASNTRSAAAVY